MNIRWSSTAQPASDVLEPASVPAEQLEQAFMGWTQARDKGEYISAVPLALAGPLCDLIYERVSKPIPVPRKNGQ